MKKTNLGKVLGILAATVLASGLVMGCDMKLDDEEDRASVSGYAPKSLEITGQTTSFVKGSEFTLGENAVVTVTYANSTEDVPNKADVTKNVTVEKPDLTTVGDGKKVTVSYTETGVTVSCEYTVSVTNPLKSIAVTTQPTQTSYDWFFCGDYKIGVPFNSDGMVVTATYEDDSTSVVDNSELTISSLAPAAAGEQNLTITYNGKETTVTVTVTSPDACGYTGTYTASAWWTEISSGNKTVAAGEAVYTKFKNNSYGASNWSGPVYRIADSTDVTEFAVCRNDNFGWGSGYATGDPAVLLDGVTLDSDWNWDTFIADVTGSTETVVVVNKGSTVDLYLFFEKGGSLIHHQFYTGIHGDGNAINFRPMADAGANITYCE